MAMVNAFKVAKPLNQTNMELLTLPIAGDSLLKLEAKEQFLGPPLPTIVGI